MAGSTLRFDLYRDSTPPGAPGPTSYIGLWLHRLTLADGLAWSGLFDGTAGDFSFQSLEFEDGSLRSKSPAALAIDFDATGQQVVVRNELPFGTVKNAHVRDFDGTGLSLSGFFGVFLELSPNTHDQQVTVARAQQGRVDLGSGNDMLVIEAFTDRFGSGRTFTVDAGAGNDTVTIAPSAGLWREAWITTNVALGDGNDVFVGMGSHDTVFGGAGDDIAELRGGTNFFDGGAGYDTLVLRGEKASYRIDNLGQGRYRLWDNDRTADGDDGITVIWNVEKVVFKDQDWIIRLPGNPNDPPVANDDGIFVVNGAQAFAYGVLLANDLDPDGDPLTIIAVGNAVGGTVVRDWANNQVIFTPTAGFVGPASFTYQVGDRQGGVAQATVSLNVAAAVDTAPVAIDAVLLTLEDVAVGFDLDATDAENNIVAFEILSVSNGTVVGFNPLTGEGVFTPAANFFGQAVITFRVTDAGGLFDDGTVTIDVAPVNDAPVGVADTVSTAFETPIVIDVIANDFDVDGDPLAFGALDNLVGGTLSLPGDGTVLFTPAPGFTGEGRFTYRPYDGALQGNETTVTITVGPPPTAVTLFYFSGSVPDFGRELWVYDPESSASGLGGDPFATMVDAAELFPGPRGTNPTEITALGNTVFWRDIWEFPLPPNVDVPNTSWHLYNLALGAALFFQTVDEIAFDAQLPLAARTLGVRSGDLFWYAVGIPGVGGGPANVLDARDAAGVEVGGALMPGAGRTLLTDAGHDPAYAAFIPTHDPATGSLFDAEQLFVVLDDPTLGWQPVQATGGGDSANDIREIAGLQIVPEPALSGELSKTLFFAGDYTDPFGTFFAGALWQVDLVNDGAGWAPTGPARLVDLNGTGGATPLDPRALTVVPVTDGHASSPESLFLFGTDDAGQGQIFAYRSDFYGGFSVSTSSLFFGNPFEGLEIRPWENGVVFTGHVPALGDSFLGFWTDPDGDGFFTITGVYSVFGGTCEHLVVDGEGNAAVVWDEGDNDTLSVFNGTSLVFQVTVAGEIDELQLAGGHLVYRAPSGGTDEATLFDYSIADFMAVAVPTDETTGGAAGDGFLSRYANIAVQNASATQGGLVFEANLGGGQGFRMLLADNGVVTGLNLLRYSEGTQFEGSWIGTGYRFDTFELGLFRVAADGTVSTLYTESTNFSDEAEILGNQVLFGTTSAATNRVLVHDIAANLTFTVLDNHLLGAAAVVGNGIVFTALDFGNPLNTDSDSGNNVWDLYRFDGATTWLATLPSGAGGGQHVYEWWRHQDFLGDDSRIFWKQANDATGVEVHTIDLTAADPAGTLAVIDTISPGSGGAANFPDATFANGRLYFQASTDGFFSGLGLYTTTDGTDVVPVTGATAADAFSGAYLTVLLDGPIEDEVFFLAGKNGQGSVDFGVFQVNDDGVTASLITPAGFGNAFGLAVLGSELYVFAFDPVSNTSQMYRFTPSAQPAVASLQQLTFFTPIDGAGSMDDIFLGGDGVVYFGRSEPATGRELWMLDSNAPTGARLVADINQDISAGGYAPEQVVAVPNPLEYWLAG